MKSLKFKLPIIILGLLLVSQSFYVQCDGGRSVSVNEDQAQDESGSIINRLLRPIRATFNQAKRLFGFSTSLPGNVRDLIADGFDEVQVRGFGLFMRAYNKTYESPEELRRRIKLFTERRSLIEQSVQAFREGKVPFVMKENEYADWDDEELKMLARASPPKSRDEMTDLEREAMLKADGQDEGIKPEGGAIQNEPSKEAESQVESDLLVTAAGPAYELDDGNLTVMAPERIPATKDWRGSGCVAEPIDQRKCGACYAIATMNTLETMRCLSLKESPKLSPQQVIDCSTPRAGYQNYGCDGGWPTRVLTYLQNEGVAARESCYPFVRRQEWCQLRKVKATSGCTVSSSPTDTTLKYKVLNNERDILYHVANTGPVITVMKAPDSFIYYSRGIYDDAKCSRRRNDVDHAIVIVGYGRENGQDYWLIKNSWGSTNWGEGGFGKYRRGTNACSIGHWGWVITS